MSAVRSYTLNRAKVIWDAVLGAGRSSGRWLSVDLDGGLTGRIWHVEGGGRTANISTRFSDVPREVQIDGYEQALLRQLAPPKWDDVLVDVYHPEAGKVLSIGSIGGADTLISMQPGPWETAFGLPGRPWSPAVARRLEAVAAR